MEKIFAIVSAVVFSILLVACETATPKVETKPVIGPLSEIRVSPENPSVIVGSEIELIAKGYDASNNEVAISPEWKIVRGAKSGKLYAPKDAGIKAVFSGKKPGNSRIEVSSGTVKKVVTVIIANPTTEMAKKFK